MTLSEDSVAQYVDRLATDAGDCHDVAQGIMNGGHEGEYPELRQIRYGLDFHRGRRSDDGFDPQPFEAKISLTDGRRYPPPLEDLSEEVETWSNQGKEISDVLVKSRLCHLVWAAQGGDKYACAVLAIDSYLALMSRSNREEVYRSDDFGYALSIALQIDDPMRINACIEKGVAWLEGLLTSEESGPGSIITTLTILASLKVQYRPESLDGFLSRAISRFDDPWLLESVREIQISIQTDSEKRKECARKSFLEWMNAAEGSSGILRAMYLEKAFEQARAFELRAEIQRATLAIQQVDLRPDMQLISVSAIISTEQLESIYAKFLDFDNLHDALMFYGSYCPISGSREEETQSAQTFLEEHVIRTLARTVRVDHEGRPQVFIRDESEQIADRIAIQAAERIQEWGVMAGIVLGRILERWNPTIADIVSYFRSETMPESVVNGLGIGVMQFSGGDWESALMVTLPRVEESLRLLASHHGFSILTPRKNRFRKRNARENLDSLKNLGDIPLLRYLDYLLVNEDSTNLRNRALHGLMGQATREEAALAIHAACALRVYAPESLRD